MKTKLRNITGVTVMGFLAWTRDAPAQTKVADPEAYRTAKETATATFLDSKRPKEERLAAAKGLGYPDEKTMAGLHEVGVDKSQDDTIRWEALRRLSYDEKYIAAVLAILDDPKDGNEVLDANLIADLSRRTTSAPPAETRQRMQAVLRKLLEDTRAKVRLNAYRALVSEHDSVAVGLLADSLRKGENVPIPLATAIDLLDQDGAVNHIGALRRYLDHEDPEVKARAAHALAVDPESRPKIVALVKNRETPAKVRLSAIRALANVDTQLADYAIPIIEDGNGDPGVRAAAMQAVAGRMNYSKVEPATQIRFAEAVEKLANDKATATDEVKKLRDAAGQLHPSLLKSFPEVKKHYDNR